MIESLNVEQMKQMLIAAGNKVIESKELLTEVDSAIGDGDHGIGMSVGFTNAIRELTEQEQPTINELFKTTGMAMIDSMGGASGVIFGTMFMSGAVKMEPLTELTLEKLTLIFENGLIAVKARGKAEMGDKTMIDALEPAVAALKEATANSMTLNEGLKAAVESAEQGVEKSKAFVAKFGRARSMGERAIGFQDAGATTVWLIFSAFNEWVEVAASNG